MAVTLPNGVVVPNADGREQISATGINEMRTLGVSADGALASAKAQAAAQAAQAEQKALDATQVAWDVDIHSRARDAVLGDQIAGMEGMTYVGTWEPGRTYRINDVVTHGGDSWARLTAGSQGTPGGSPMHWGLVARRGAGGGFGELAETAVTGLWEGVDAGIAARLAALEYDSGWRDVSEDLLYGAAGVLHIRRRDLQVWWRTRNLIPGSAHAFYLPPSELRAPESANTYPADDGTTGAPFYRDGVGRICRSIYLDPVSAGHWWEGTYVLSPGTPEPTAPFGKNT